MKYETFRRYQWYIIIGLVSFVSLFFLPMLGSEVGLEWKAPTSPAGWILYVVQNMIVAVVSIIIFHCFVMQGEKNVEENEEYQRAKKILKKTVVKEEKPRSPSKWKAQTYGLKGACVAVFSGASLVGLSNAILVFDWVMMLSYMFAVTMSISFGLIQMSATEKYYTDEYVRYADEIERTKEEERNGADYD